ncbi:MAG: hypothetical protein RSE94_16115 [Pseudomonas sp.]
MTREQRLTHFARQWRCSLLFSAVQAKLASTLSEAGLQCLVDFYHGQADRQAPAVILMPLAFEREPSASQADVVSGMYVFFPDDAARVLLYRPLYADNALMEFTSIDALMAAIAQTGPLQDSILQWLPAEARPVYDHGGFDEPHLRRPIIDPSILPEPVKPASLQMQFWKINVDSKLYKANRDLLVELADRQSVSNAESRWALLRQGAWILFNVTAISLRGPVATVAWLLQAIDSLKGDVQALEHGSESEKTTALIDLILNVVMTLLHVRLPRVEPPLVSRLPGAEGFSGTAPQGLGPTITDLVPEQGKQGLAGSLAASDGMLLDFSWHQGSGVNRLPERQRKALFSLRADVDLNGLKVLESGDGRDLYLVGDSHYATLDGANYRVEVSAQGVRVVGNEGTLGPRLLREGRQWRIDAGLRLLGGGPKRRMELVKKENLKEFDELNAKQESIAAESVEVTKEFNESEGTLNKKMLDLQRLRATAEKIDLSKPDGMKLRNAFGQRITMTERGIFFSRSLTIENLKKVIAVNLKRDRALADMVKPNLAKHELMAEIKKKRSSVRYRLISDIGNYYNRIVTLIYYIKDVAQINGMNFEPVEIHKIGNYFFVLSLVEKIVAMRDELVWVSKHLDWLLVDTMNDLDIVFARDPGEEQQSKSSKVESLIRQRSLTGNDIQLNMLQELAYFSVDRGLEVDFEIMRQHHEKLWSAELNSAGTAHGALATVDVSVADEINILNDALKEYRVFQGYATYLSEAGGVVIKTEALQRYQHTLETLITSAESALAQAIRESESIDAAIPKPKLYRHREGKHHVVRTKTGRRVIAEEAKVDGILVVQQKSAEGDKVLITFNRQGEQWVEQVEEPAAEPQPVANANDIGAARTSARTAIGQVESVLKLANQYIASNQPIGMQSVIEGHVERLKAVSKALDSTGIASEFGTQLTDAIKRLSDSESELLTRYHLTTRHPTAASLRFLFNTRKISIKRTTTRKALAANDFLDVYEIRSVPSRGDEQGRAIWEAHFHYKDSATPARQFAKGHLKTWSQRLIGRKVQLEAASSSGELVAVYRGNLVLSDVDGIIPFA